MHYQTKQPKIEINKQRIQTNMPFVFNLSQTLRHSMRFILNVVFVSAVYTLPNAMAKSQGAARQTWQYDTDIWNWINPNSIGNSYAIVSFLWFCVRYDMGMKYSMSLLLVPFSLTILYRYLCHACVYVCLFVFHSFQFDNRMATTFITVNLSNQLFTHSLTWVG